MLLLGLIMTKIKFIETLGAGAGIIGAFLVALKFGNYGYPFFLFSSMALLFSAIMYKQRNHVALQLVYFLANMIGFFNYV